MRSRLAVTLLIGATVAISACGSSGDSAPTETAETADTSGAAAVTVTVPVPSTGDGVGSLGDAVEVMAGAPGQAGDAACEVDRQTLTTAEELFLTLNARMPTSQAELVEQQLIKEPSPRFEITADGEIVPAPGSACI